jgi:hypothetical protein
VSQKLALLLIVATAGCMESMAPTPVSSNVSITPVNPATRGDETQTGSRFAMRMTIRNTGTRTIYLDRLYSRTEKLVDQRWELAIESTLTPFGAVRTIGPGQSFALDFVMLYVRGQSIPSSYLEHPRGLYRVRFRFSFTANGSELLPPEESYSQPFAVE